MRISDWSSDVCSSDLRNELLKQFDNMSENDWQNHLFAWDVKFAELSASIIKARTNFISHANEHLSRIYSDIAGTSHTVSARYQSMFPVVDDGLQQSIMHRLESARLDRKSTRLNSSH